MTKNKTNTDPYAAPPMHHDKSGPVVRVAILGGLLGAAALGYAWMAGQPQTASLVPEQTAQEQQVADAGYQVAENTIPEAMSEALPPAQAPVATPAPQRRAAPARRETAPEPTPAPEIAPPTAAPLPASPTPLPPLDTPPATGAVGE